MKRKIDNYIFDPTNSTISLIWGTVLKSENILLITNTSEPDELKRSIYNFTESTTIIQVVNNVITLVGLDLSSMNSTDSLLIYIDIDDHEHGSEIYKLHQQFSFDTNMQEVLGSDRIVEDKKINSNVTYKDQNGTAILYGSNSYIDIPVDGIATLNLQLTGGWVGTISFETSLDRTVFWPLPGLSSIGATNQGQSYNGISATSNGITRFSVSGLKVVRVRFTSYSSGVTILLWNKSVHPMTTMAQMNSSLQLATQDGVIGAVNRPGFEGFDWLRTPTMNPSWPGMPTTNLPMRVPQRLQSIRASIIGDQKVALPQMDNSFELKVAYPDMYRLLENIYIQVSKQTEILALANNVTLPNGWDTSN